MTKSNAHNFESLKTFYVSRMKTILSSQTVDFPDNGKTSNIDATC